MDFENFDFSIFERLSSFHSNIEQYILNEIEDSSKDLPKGFPSESNNLNLMDYTKKNGLLKNVYNFNCDISKEIIYGLNNTESFHICGTHNLFDERYNPIDLDYEDFSGKIFDSFCGENNISNEEFFGKIGESKNLTKNISHINGEKNSFISKKRYREKYSKEKTNRIFSIEKCKKKNNCENTHANITTSKNNENFIILFRKQDEADDKANNLEAIKSFNERHYNLFTPFGKDSKIRKLIDAIIKKKSQKKRTLLTYFLGECFEQKITKCKEKPYDLRKKAKARFHKELKNTFNLKLDSVKATYKLDFLPQEFIINLTKGKNMGIINMTLEELLLTNFNIGLNNVSQTTFDRFQNNKNLLEYLKNNKCDINKIFNFDAVKNMTYRQIYEEYLVSKEFENEIANLKENYLYIVLYIYYAVTLMDYFDPGKSKIN